MIDPNYFSRSAGVTMAIARAAPISPPLPPPTTHTRPQLTEVPRENDKGFSDETNATKVSSRAGFRGGKRPG